MSDEYLENRTFDEITIGETASLSRRFTQQDIDLFALVSGDLNPALVDPVYAKSDIFHKVVAHGLLSGGLISSVLGTRLPGPGTIYLEQDLRFLKPVEIDDTITAVLTVREKDPKDADIVLDCRCENQRGDLVVLGVAKVRAPREKICVLRAELPDIRLMRHDRFHALLARTAGLPALPTAVAHPCDAASIAAAIEAAKAGLIVPILVGPRGRIRRRRLGGQHRHLGLPVGGHAP